MPDLAIRPYDAEDFDSLVDLWGACDLLRPWNDPRHDVARCLAAADAALFVGVAGTALVTSVMVGQDGHRGWLYYLGVAPDQRGKGYARQMLAHAETWLLERGVPKVQLMVRDGNAAAQAFYRRAGYDTDPVIVMRRWLIEPPATPPGA